MVEENKKVEDSEMKVEKGNVKEKTIAKDIEKKAVSEKVADSKKVSSMKEKPEEKKEEKKVSPKKEVVKKEVATARGNSLRISPKYSKYVCKLISRKSPEKAAELLELVILKKLAVKMPSLEVPHQKGKGVAGAKFPVNAAKEILGVVRQLNANCMVNNLNEPVISVAMSNKASAPRRRAGRKAKRTNIYLEAVEKTKLIKKKK